jgi:myosin heavy subunit
MTLGLVCRVQGGCFTLEDVDDAEEFERVKEALLTLGVRSDRVGGR